MVWKHCLNESLRKHFLCVIVIVVIGCSFFINVGHSIADQSRAILEQQNGVLLDNVVDRIVSLCKNADERLGMLPITENAVRQIQRWLYTSGYLSQGEDDGILGKRTAAALSSYQDEHGLDATGRATLQTQFLLSLSGSVYEQNATDGYYTGGLDYCILVYDEGNQTTVFFGEATFGQPSGQGICVYSNADVYIGNFFDGKRSGNGVMYFSDGDKYSGNWTKDKMEGYGVYSFGELGNENYIGYWKSNMMNGEGTYTFPDGSKVSGVWKDNLLQGGVS